VHYVVQRVNPAVVPAMGVPVAIWGFKTPFGYGPWHRGGARAVHGPPRSQVPAGSPVHVSITGWPRVHMSRGSESVFDKRDAAAWDPERLAQEFARVRLGSCISIAIADLNGALTEMS